MIRCSVFDVQCEAGRLTCFFYASISDQLRVCSFFDTINCCEKSNMIVRNIFIKSDIDQFNSFIEERI